MTFYDLAGEPLATVGDPVMIIAVCGRTPIYYYGFLHAPHTGSKRDKVTVDVFYKSYYGTGGDKVYIRRFEVKKAVMPSRVLSFPGLCDIAERVDSYLEENGVSDCQIGGVV